MIVTHAVLPRLTDDFKWMFGWASWFLPVAASVVALGELANAFYVA